MLQNIKICQIHGEICDSRWLHEHIHLGTDNTKHVKVFLNSCLIRHHIMVGFLYVMIIYVTNRLIRCSVRRYMKMSGQEKQHTPELVMQGSPLCVPTS